MRVYEFARLYDISTKEVLERLKSSLGQGSLSHMAVLTKEQQEFLEKSFALQADDALKPQEILEKNPVAKKPSTPVKGAEPVVEKSSSIILAPMSPDEVAAKIDIGVADIILTLLKWGKPSAKNKILSQDLVEKILEHYEIPFERPTKKRVGLAQVSSSSAIQAKDFVTRAPVVVVLGHVDHGKTTFLDYVRNTRVAAREKGGITQHVGAYEVRLKEGVVVFLDTPGHEAFSKIRARGLGVADIAVLVIAADDGIKPQTVEAIKVAKSMEVPIVVAINKIDKVESVRLEVVKRELAQHDLLPEEWGGNVICVGISAKFGTGVKELLEMILLQAEMMELQSSLKVPAEGYILESRQEKGRGPVATLLCRHGIIKTGDYFLCGEAVGRVTSLVDSYGKNVSQAAPSIPVLLAGFSTLPSAGDYFEVISVERYRKVRQGKAKTPLSHRVTFVEKNDIHLIIKADTNSSKEALIDSIEKLSKKFEKGFSILRVGVGDISERDIEFAADTKAFIIGFTVKAEPNAVVLAHKHGIAIHQFSIIYKLLDYLDEVALGAQEIKVVTTKTGEAVVRRVFPLKNLSKIAGCYVNEGTFVRDGIIVVWRGKIQIGKGKIKSLQREKRVVKEVHAGFECGFVADGFNDWEEGDRVECFIEQPEKK